MTTAIKRRIQKLEGDMHQADDVMVELCGRLMTRGQVRELLAAVNGKTRSL